MTKVEPINLSNAADGELELEFQRQVAKALEVFADAPEYESKNGVTSCSTVLEVHFSRDADTGSVSVAVRGKFRAPKRRLVARDATIIDGELCVSGEQIELPYEEQLGRVRRAAQALAEPEVTA